MPKVNLGIKTVQTSYTKANAKIREKALRKAQRTLKDNAFSPKMFNVLNSDIVNLSIKKQPNPVVDSATAYKEISSMNIAQLRFLDTKTYSGETLEGAPEKLKKLREVGINTIVDFREEAGSIYKNECTKNGLEYFKFPLKHSANFSIKDGVPEEFVQNLKKFFEICNKGNVYMGCKWGIDRTNLALMMNYLMNPEPHIAPQITAWGGESTKNIINKNYKIIEKMSKALTPEQRKSLDLSEECSYTMKKRMKNLLMKSEM